MSDTDSYTDRPKKVETTLIDIVESAGQHAGLDETPRLERVEVTDETLANVRLHLRPGHPETNQENNNE